MRRRRIRSSLRRCRIERLESRKLLAATSPPPILQWFDSSFETIEERAPDLFQTGYGAIWLPPPGRADSGNQSVGYDVYDRFDLGSPDHSTLYGTETGLQQLAKVFDRTSTSLHVDAIINHAGFSDRSTEGFVESGGYPGLAITLPTAEDGDFHAVSASGDREARLSGLVDIDHATNHAFIRHPVDPLADNNLPAGTNPDPFGRLSNLPSESNARFYPDRDGQARFLFDPVTNESDIAVYSFDTTDPVTGDAVAENATGYLMRYMQWMVEVIGVDGFRIDAAKHFDGFVMDFLDRAVYRSNPRTLLDGSTDHVFSYSEIFDGDKDFLLSYLKKNIDPNDPGRIGGNRDILDFSAFFAMRDNLSSPGTPNAWFNVRDSLLDRHDDGVFNGSAGVLFVRSHDEFGPTSLGNVAHAMTLMHPGNAVVYFNGSEFGQERDFPKAGRGDALGGVYGNTIQNLISIRNTHGRGDFQERWIDNEGIYVFEREQSALVGLSNRGDGGFDERTIQVAFAPGTRLVELTGNATDPNIDPNDDLPDFIEVSPSQTVTLRIPRNVNANGQWHGSGYVIYGLAAPESSTGIELLGVDSILPGSQPETNDAANGRTRLNDLHVVTGDRLTVQLKTDEVYLPGSSGQRDFAADGDQALLRLDGGIDVNGNGQVDHVTPEQVDYGFEFFTDKSSPWIGPQGPTGPRGDGEFLQQIDTTQLSEGVHFVEARAFRHRPDGGPAVFTDFKESIYVDRLPPESTVESFLPFVEGINENRDLVVRSLDKTANSVHVFMNLPAALNDSEILNLVAGENRARKIDRDQFVYGFFNVAHGNQVATIVSYEQTGNMNVQRIPGLFTSTIVGRGLGDLDFDGQIDIVDVQQFETVVCSEQTAFNPAADFDGNGLVDYADLQRYSESLAAANASQTVRDALELVRAQKFRAVDDQYLLSEDDIRTVIASGILTNDLDPGSTSDFSLLSTGAITSELGLSVQVDSDGSFTYDARGRFDTLQNGQSATDAFDYVVGDGFGNESTGRIEITVTGLNDPPALGELDDIQMVEDGFIEPIRLAVSDPDNAINSLQISTQSTNQELFDDGGLGLSFSEGTWILQISPVAEQSGSSVISITVEDGGTDGDPETLDDNSHVTQSFNLIVAAENDPPTFAPPSNLAIDKSADPQTISLTQVTPGGGEQQPLRIAATSRNEGLIPNPQIELLSEMASAELTFTPVAGQSGTSTIDVTLEDGGFDQNLDTPGDNNTTTQSFVVAVGLSSYQTVQETLRLTLRSPDPSTGLSRTDTEIQIDLNAGSWFRIDQTPSELSNRSLRIPMPAESTRIELISDRGRDFQFDAPSNWRMGSSEIVAGSFYRSIRSQNVTPITTLHVAIPHPWQNVVRRSDVDNSGDVTANDALRIINELRNRIYSSRGSSVVADPLSLPSWPGTYFDVSGNDEITALDALRVINELAIAANTSESEGEGMHGFFRRWPNTSDSTVDERAFDIFYRELADFEIPPKASPPTIKPSDLPSKTNVGSLGLTLSGKITSREYPHDQVRANHLKSQVKTLAQDPA
ncbi:MAG: dockerin type I domain-containing protein [Rubripirellula sp.]|nr:dockerin type I domain-containing protein [Rubripirellula sp.]